MKILKFIIKAILITGAYIAAIFMGERAAKYYYNSAKLKFYELFEDNI